MDWFALSMIIVGAMGVGGGVVHMVYVMFGVPRDLDAKEPFRSFSFRLEQAARRRGWTITFDGSIYHETTATAYGTNRFAPASVNA